MTPDWPSIEHFILGLFVFSQPFSQVVDCCVRCHYLAQNLPCLACKIEAGESNHHDHSRFSASSALFS